MAAEQIPEYARVFMEALKEAEVSVVTALPESLLATVYRLCDADNAIRYSRSPTRARCRGSAPAPTWPASGR